MDGRYRCPDEGTKKTELPPPSHHSRILSIRPSSARRHPAFLVGRIDLANNFAITPLQSHPSEIRRSELSLSPRELDWFLINFALIPARYFAPLVFGDAEPALLDYLPFF